MQVLCIDENMQVDLFADRGLPQPNFGDIDTVIDEGVWKDNNGNLDEYYRLQRFGESYGYSKKHFSPLSDLNELELVNEKQLVNQ